MRPRGAAWLAEISRQNKCNTAARSPRVGTVKLQRWKEVKSQESRHSVTDPSIALENYCEKETSLCKSSVRFIQLTVVLQIYMAAAIDKSLD